MSLPLVVSGILYPLKPHCHAHEINHCRMVQQQQLQRWFTFLTSLMISSVDEQVAWTLWEKGQDEELQECWDAGGGEQDGPVLLFAQELPVKSHRDQTPRKAIQRKGLYFM